MKKNLLLCILSLTAASQILAQGFANTSTNWTLPTAGGAIYSGTLASFVNLFDNGSGNDNGSQAWTTTDINGDGKPDLVAFLEKTAGDWVVPGPQGARFWKVYLNTGTGFSNTATNWTLPTTGGAIYSGTLASFVNLFDNGSGNDNGSQAWTTTDIDGDGKMDLVAFLEKQSGNYDVPGPQGARFWKVYLNNGTGFANTAVNWTLPATGGAIYSGTPASFVNLFDNGSGNDNGSQAWTTTDINGDGKPDLVAFLEKQSGNYDVPGPQGARFWKVYMNLSPVGVVENDPIDFDLNVYPNPFTDKFIIATDKKVGANIQVFNSLGILVSSQEMTESKAELNLKGQPSGIYFARIGSVTKKLIKE
jgi:hypothetical protein